MRMRVRPLALALAALSASGCGEPPIADGYRSDEVRCTSCHGRDDDAAPPRSLSGGESTAEVGVGAHRRHLRDGAIRAAVACGECHIVPNEVGAKGHVDALPAEVEFGALSRSHDTQPRWMPETLTCATYCHGDGLAGGQHTRPKWTRVDGSQSRCDSCHGNPPPAPHPQSTRCAGCHTDTVDELGRIVMTRGLHINGVIDSNGTECNSCHGARADGAPPSALDGATSTSARGVGAHDAHLSSVTHLAVECSACHVVPLAVGDTGHADDDDRRAEVVFSGLAVHEARTPTFDIGEVGCSNTYCHGDGRDGRRAPVWTTVDGTFSSCDSCHGYPPPQPHPARSDCASCHGMVVNADDTFVAAELHIDGVIESSGVACTSCHGEGGQAAPPRDTSGNTMTTSRGVGAHTSHLATSTRHAPIACAECHQVPSALDDPGHFDTALPAELAFGPLARARGALPTFDGVGCSNIACHGGARQVGGTNNAPVWTTVDGTQAACGTCHGLPPPAPHPARADCGACHGAVIDAANVFVDGARHVNGTVDVACNACHGDDASAAPPRDLAGNEDTIFTGVGAHASHLRSTELHAAIACSECHRVPTDVDDVGHRDSASPAEIHFGPLASADGADAAWNGVTCATYCHGGSAAIQGGTLTNPSWTVVDGTQAACGSCHGLPPPAPHPTAPPTGCGGCHPFSGTQPLDPSLHINGVVERP